ncbi:hypothetical protein TgHK011_004795 [Trichoderma gracile]|nr:hypothetical protein TgHK011_004795 [Trichoderma gracile]
MNGSCLFYSSTSHNQLVPACRLIDLLSPNSQSKEAPFIVSSQIDFLSSSPPSLSLPPSPAFYHPPPSPLQHRRPRISASGGYGCTRHARIDRAPKAVTDLDSFARPTRCVACVRLVAASPPKGNTSDGASPSRNG